MNKSKKFIIVSVIIYLLFTLLSILISIKLYNNYKLNLINDINMTENIDNIVIDSIINKKTNSFKIIIISFNIVFNLIIFSIYILLLIIKKLKNDQKIKEINNYINNILNGDYSFDIRNYNEGTLDILKNDIYKLTIRLKEQTEAAIKDKNNLEIILSDISHQIKTPLTSMNIINDLLINSKLSKKEQIEFLNKNKIQLEKIEWLVISLLKLARLDNGFINFNIEKVNSQKLIEKSLESMLIQIELKNQKIIKNIEDFDFNIDLNWTVEALTNIIKNSYEHTPNSGTIKISTSDNPIYSSIIVANNGEEINPKDLPHIFERFYKGKTQKESVGIGLNLTKKIIELEGGEILVNSKKNNGTSFEIRFYKNVI